MTVDDLIPVGTGCGVSGFVKWTFLSLGVTHSIQQLS